MRLFSAILFCSVLSYSSAQSDIIHMQYNLTLYGNPFGCDDSQNDVDLKDGYLKDIVAHAGAHVLCVNELGDEDVLADRILNNSLNVDGETNWQRAELSDDATFSSIINGFYFRSDIFTMQSQSYLNQSVDGEWLLRPIDLYSGFLNELEPMTQDTVFITFIVCHLAASDAVERALQTEAIMSELEERGPGNYILSGDFNIDSSSEESFQNLIDNDIPTLDFIDPVDALGTWHNNSGFADYHTQSTRFNDTNAGCFTGGGLDDRFDFTMVSESVYVGSEGLLYTPDSYEVMGQSGMNYNSELVTLGNTVVPADIAVALYEMSDHLPIVSAYHLSPITSIGEYAARYPEFRFSNPVGQELRFFESLPLGATVQIFDVRGSLVSTTQINQIGQSQCDVQFLDSGMYLLNITQNETSLVSAPIIKY